MGAPFSYNPQGAPPNKNKKKWRYYLKRLLLFTILFTINIVNNNGYISI